METLHKEKFKNIILGYYKKERYLSCQNKKKDEAVSKFITHWLIALRLDSQETIQLIEKYSISLMVVDPNTQMTTLALAMLLHKEKIAKHLANNQFNWKYLLTHSFDAFTKVDQELLKAQFCFSVTHTWFEEEGKMFKLSDWTTKKVNKKLNKRSYQDYISLTNYKKSDEFFKSALCSTEGIDLNLNGYFFQIRKAYFKMPPQFLIKKNPVLTKLCEESSLGVYAKEKIPFFTFLCEYTGLLETTLSETPMIFLPDQSYYKNVFSKSREYVLEEVDGKEVGNLGGLMNFGFPNTISMTFFNDFKRSIFISTAEIQKNEELLWNYGPNYRYRLYTTVFCLLGKENMLSFFKNSLSSVLKEYDQLALILKSAKTAESLIHCYSWHTKIQYLLSVPSAFILLHVEGLVDMNELLESKHILVTNFKESSSIGWNMLLLIKQFFNKLDCKLSNNLSLKKEVYSFIINHIEQISIVHLLHLLQLMLKIEDLEINFSETAERLVHDLNNYDWEADQNHVLSFKSYIKNNLFNEFNVKW